MYPGLIVYPLDDDLDNYSGDIAANTVQVVYRAEVETCWFYILNYKPIYDSVRVQQGFFVGSQSAAGQRLEGIVLFILCDRCNIDVVSQLLRKVLMHPGSFLM